MDKFLDFLVALINLRDKKAIKHVTDLTTRQGVYGSQMSTKVSIRVYRLCMKH